VHRLSADNRYRPINGQFADWPIIVSANYRHWPIICFSKQDNKKCLIPPAKYRNGLGQAVTKNYKLVKLRQECYQSTIVPLWLHKRYNMTFI